MANIDTNIKGPSATNKGRNWYWWKERFRDVSRSCSDSKLLPPQPVPPNRSQPGAAWAGSTPHRPLDTNLCGSTWGRTAPPDSSKFYNWFSGGLDLWGPQSSQWFPLHILRNPKERFVIATYHSFPMGFISFTMFLSQSNLLGIVLKFFWEVSLPALTLNHSYSGNKILEWLLFSLLLF